MEFEFDLPSVNPDEVREIEVIKDGKSYGVYFVKPFISGSPQYMLDYRRALAKLSKREKARVGDPQTVEDVQLHRGLLIRLFVEKYVTKSEGIPLKSGVWKHTNENLIKFLTQPAAWFIYQELDEFSAETSNSEAAEVVAEKNS